MLKLVCLSVAISDVEFRRKILEVEASRLAQQHEESQHRRGWRHKRSKSKKQNQSPNQAKIDDETVKLTLGKFQNLVKSDAEGVIDPHVVESLFLEMDVFKTGHVTERQLKTMQKQIQWKQRKSSKLANDDSDSDDSSDMLFDLRHAKKSRRPQTASFVSHASYHDLLQRGLEAAFKKERKVARKLAKANNPLWKPKAPEPAPEDRDYHEAERRNGRLVSVQASSPKRSSPRHSRNRGGFGSSTSTSPPSGSFLPETGSHRPQTASARMQHFTRRRPNSAAPHISGSEGGRRARPLSSRVRHDRNSVLDEPPAVSEDLLAETMQISRDVYTRPDTQRTLSRKQSYRRPATATRAIITLPSAGAQDDHDATADQDGPQRMVPPHVEDRIRALREKIQDRAHDHEIALTAATRNLGWLVVDTSNASEDGQLFQCLQYPELRILRGSKASKRRGAQKRTAMSLSGQGSSMSEVDDDRQWGLFYAVTIPGLCLLLLFESEDAATKYFDGSDADDSGSEEPEGRDDCQQRSNNSPCFWLNLEAVIGVVQARSAKYVPRQSVFMKLSAVEAIRGAASRTLNGFALIQPCSKRNLELHNAEEGTSLFEAAVLIPVPIRLIHERRQSGQSNTGSNLQSVLMSLRGIVQGRNEALYVSLLKAINKRRGVHERDDRLTALLRNCRDPDHPADFDTVLVTALRLLQQYGHNSDSSDQDEERSRPEDTDDDDANTRRIRAQLESDGFIRRSHSEQCRQDTSPESKQGGIPVDRVR